MQFMSSFCRQESSLRVGSAVGAKDYLAYHSHFHSDFGEVYYVVVPFSADVQIEKRAAARSILATSLNPEGHW
jgi:hypothetical protein